MFLFRPPFGRYDGQVLQCAENMGYVTVLGNTDSMDWKGYGPDAAAGAVLAAENGSIVIFRLGAPDTEEALKTFYRNCVDRGCAALSLSHAGNRSGLYGIKFIFGDLLFEICRCYTVFNN